MFRKLLAVLILDLKFKIRYFLFQSRLEIAKTAKNNRPL
jgi:hypothetical protein